MKKILLSFLLVFSSVSAVELKEFIFSPEVGVNLGYQGADLRHRNSDGNDFTYGAYGRIWMGKSHVLIAPQVKYDVIGKDSDYQNLQAGGLFGLQFLPVTIYVGASWSHFYSLALKDAWVINYGIVMNVPLIPFLTIGLDASYQRPDIVGGGSVSMNRVGVTLGVAF